MKRDLTEYPRRLWRRAWVVLDSGIILRSNGSSLYIGYTNRQPGEVFLSKADADYVCREHRRILVAIGAEKRDCRVQPILIPVMERSPHAQRMRVLKRKLAAKLRAEKAWRRG